MNECCNGIKEKIEIFCVRLSDLFDSGAISEDVTRCLVGELLEVDDQLIMNLGGDISRYNLFCEDIDDYFIKKFKNEEVQDFIVV
ncbi:hypothetical protein Q5O24_13230 [Eubacteriaceae bacterium ES3]|nr:hypothetical protein Q5O24_13230 [Eubacteriaceae bacterium ES3]